MAHVQAHTSLYRPGPPAQGMMLFKVKWAFLHQLSIQKTARQDMATDQSMEASLSDDFQFCQADSDC